MTGTSIVVRTSRRSFGGQGAFPTSLQRLNLFFMALQIRDSFFIPANELFQRDADSFADLVKLREVQAMLPEFVLGDIALLVSKARRHVRLA